jgi:anti-sigma regulatory factor (Ser/Thr protein kinase)
VLPTKIGWETSIGGRRELFNAIEKKGMRSVTLDLSGAESIYPNGIVPIIAQVDYHRRRGVEINVVPPRNAEILRIYKAYGWAFHLCPQEFSLSTKERTQYSQLATFSTDTELNDEINRVLDVCFQQLVFAEGVPQAFEWALNEIAGNVLVHSEFESGWIQVVTYKESQRLSLIVCDSGVGIPNSMRERYEFAGDKEGIELAVQKGTTSKPDFGQGNGLAGTLAIAKQSSGSFAITSGAGQLQLINDRISLRRNTIYFNGTFVQLQLPTNAPIDLPSALWGHSPASYVELKFTNDAGEIVFDPRTYASSFGNRITGQKLRIVVLNLIMQNQGKVVAVRMDHISILASSFADELFGKLFVELGPIDYSSLIKLVGINPLCKGIINQAISERVAETQMQKTLATTALSKS